MTLSFTGHTARMRSVPGDFLCAKNFCILETIAVTLLLRRLRYTFDDLVYIHFMQ